MHELALNIQGGRRLSGRRGLPQFDAERFRVFIPSSILTQLGPKAMHLNLIWTLTPRSLAEDDWIHWLLQDFDIVDHVAPGWNLFQDNSIYILSGPYSRLPRWFLDGVSRVRGKGLFHLADESFHGRIRNLHEL